MSKSKWIGVFTAASALLMLGSLVACQIERGPGGTWTVRPAPDAKPRQLPPSRVEQFTRDGVCYFRFRGKSGIWYCFPCDLQGKGYAEPCDQLFGDSDSAGLFANLDQILATENVAGNSDAILQHFGLDNWTPGSSAPIPMAMELIDTVQGRAEIIVFSRSDWDLPDDTHATVEMVVFPDASGSVPDVTDSVPDAVAFRVSGSFEDVAESIASMFDSGFFIWMQWNNTTIYTVESTMIQGGSYDIEVRENNSTLWTN